MHSLLSNNLTNLPFNSSANNEIEEGTVQTFAVTHDGLLSEPISNVSSGGASPAYVSVLSTEELAVFNYVGGNGRIIPLGSDAVTFDNSAKVITFPTPANVNQTSHPHEAVEYKGEVFVPDLGGDKVYRLTGGHGTYAITSEIPQPAGSGPRHIAFNGMSRHRNFMLSNLYIKSDGYLYTLHELASTLSSQSVPSAPNGTVHGPVRTASIVPDNNIEGAVWQAAEILIPQTTPEYPTPYIYVSNRNTGTVDPEGKGDTIAIFEHVNKGKRDEALRLVKQFYTGLEQVRGLAVAESCEGGEKYLVAAAAAGTGGIAVFERTEGGKNLVEVARNTEVPVRTSFAFLC